jgi:membrane associated rhomboid family serine protease
MSVAPVTRWLIRLNVAVFALEAFSGDAVTASLALWPIGSERVLHGLTIGFRPWQIVTSAFLHASLAHLALNMFALHVFGGDVERALGSWRFGVLYGASVVSAAVVQLVVTSVPGAVPHPTVGASGGVFGVLLAFAMLYPRRVVMLVFPPVPMRAWFFVALYGLIELVNGVLGTKAGVAHFAHLGGMLGAYLVLRRWRRRAREGLTAAEPPELMEP